MHWWRRKQRERDLERELRSHLELEAEEWRETGLSPEDARYAAQRGFGNTTLIKEDVRRMWTWTTVEQIAQDTKYALRGMRKSPGFAVTAVLSLALGIGANTAIFTVVNAVLMKPLPFPEPERLVQLWESKPSKGVSGNVVNPFNFLDWRERTRSFEGLAAVLGLITNLTGLGDPLALNGTQVSPQYFSILGVAPALGRAFSAEEGQPGHDRVVILSYGLWQSRFGGDSAVLGRTVMINGEPSTIVGVMPSRFTLPRYNADLWMPLPIARTKLWEGGRFLTVVARLKPGITLRQAQDDLRSVAEQSARERPRFNEGWSAEAVPMLEDATGKIRLPLLVLLAATGLVVLIACANVANLLLMRASSRLREISVRAALGAGKRRLLQQLLSESLVLAIVASLSGLAIAYGGVKALVAMVPYQSQLPRLDSIHMDGSVLLFTFALSIVTTAIFSLFPSFQVSQIDPQQALQQSTSRTTTRGILRRVLVVIEIALSLILLIGAGLMLRSFHRLITVNPGFVTDRILTMTMFTSPAKYGEKQKRAGYFARLLEEIRTVPGVQQAGSIHFLPLQEQVSGSCFAPAGEPPPTPARSAGSQFLVVSPGYFQAMRTPLLNGRYLDARDRYGATSVIMVNREFVKQYLPARDPIGQKLNLCWPVENPAEIVGVVADARQTELQKAPKPTIFVNNIQAPMYFAQLVVRAAVDPQQLARSVQQAIHRVDPDQAVTHVQTMDAVFSDSVAQPRLQLVLLAAFGGIAALLATVGIYGVVAYSAARRTREIGIRMALGAVPNDVRRLLLQEGMILGVLGIGVGLAGGLVLTRVLESLLFETSPTDPATLAFVAGTVLVIIFVATLIPANRAARVDPTVALRYE
jgi:predicted permease